jgi:hypothetical protein
MLCGCSTEKDKRKYFVVETPSGYEGYIHVIFNSDKTGSRPLFQKGAYVSVSVDTSGLVFIKDKYEDWMAKLQITFIDKLTKQGLMSDNSGMDSIQVFNPKVINIAKQKTYKCFEAFITKELLPAKGSPELNNKKMLKQYQVEMLLSQL